MTTPGKPAQPIGPYFFLSYAHVPSNDLAGRGDPNKWIERLFRDLCDHIVQLTRALPGETGYIDRDLRTGDNWSQTLSERLSACRVFVPLYSPRYFESEQCGKEWAAFLGRASHYEGPGAIVPAIWAPVRAAALPHAAQAIQFNHTELGVRYAEEGFYGIMKLRKYRDHYQAATFALAQRIVEVAESAPMPYGKIRDYTTMPSVFAGHTPERPVTVTVVAPDLDSLPEGRGVYHYGRTPREWDPFRSSGGMRSLADRADLMARSRGFLPHVGTLEEHAEALSAKVPHSPGVMLVDPWATAGDDCRELLRPVNQPGRQWITVMVPWNPEDQESVQQRPRLKACLNEALGHKLAEPTAVPDVPTLDVFGIALPEALNKATQHYFKHAPAYPPEGETVDRPRLVGPEE
ncbi:TIR-like protein FxsC [Streptosporangium sp. NPDC051023]|uniref:TIR-like protein FxsC n=1 Tax=Streptosporangium sp. NPDC051023 TaxID=3155410 RepID=UPI00344EDB3A